MILFHVALHTPELISGSLQCALMTWVSVQKSRRGFCMDYGLSLKHPFCLVSPSFNRIGSPGLSDRPIRYNQQQASLACIAHCYYLHSLPYSVHHRLAL